MKILASFVLFCFSWLSASAQTVPTPAPKQTKPIVIQNGRIHVGNGKVIEQGKIIFSEGKITYVGAKDGGANPATSEIIDATNHDIYPGLIALNNSMGLVELPSVRATRDVQEVGDFNPNIRSCIAYNTDSHIIPTVRANGVALTQPTPEGGRMPGQSSIMQTDGWNWEDAVYGADLAIHLNWPQKYSRQGGRFEGGALNDSPEYLEDLQELTRYFQEAFAYYNMSNPTVKNLKLEAMKGLFDGSKKLFVDVDIAPCIVDAVEFCKKSKVNCVIVGGGEAYLVSKYLVENNIPVVLGRTQSLPNSDDDEIDKPYTLPGLLHKDGVKFALSIGGNWQPRNLPFQAGQVVSYGLPYEMAIAALTSVPAEIVGLDKRTGTLEVGKDANIVISQGDILDMKSSKVLHLFIQGRDVNLNNKQTDLYKKFSQKYKH